MNKPRGALLEQLLVSRRPPGYALLADFLAELGREIPLTPTTERVAKAFRKILSDEADAAYALELTRTPGRPRSADTFSDVEDMRFIAERIEADSKSRGALDRALDAAVAHFRRVDRRQLERRWKKFGPSVMRFNAVMDLMTQDSAVDLLTQDLERRWRAATPRQRAAARRLVKNADKK